MAYEVNKYFEYFAIDESYYPEINESSIKDPKNKWQDTFPHSDIVVLLKMTERVLSRADKKGLWIEGSYGTGKSRIIWMMQNLLTCTEDEFDAYFDEYDNLRNEIDLRERLRAVRNGKVITACRYATGDITSTQKLIFAVFDSITFALKQSGCKFDGSKTLRGKIAAWLEKDRANLDMFRAKIQKPEYRMSATLANRSAEEIIERLKNPEAEVSQLVEDILKLGEREGILAFNIDMKELMEWIDEVIEENNLKALVFFWDEFSKFFNNNRNNLDEFQRLAELSNITPFYFVIATHESESLAGEGDQAFRIIHDRFNHKNITMPDNIAFELIGHALKVKDAVKNDWKYISAALKDRTAVPRKVVMEFAKIRDEKILTDILPIHPTAAILLKNLATYFASNQRSVFNFIKNNDPNVEAFQSFIATKSPENGDLLTIDYLWNFFYDSGTDGNGNVGRMNLKQSIRTILDSYTLNKNNLDSDEQIVLKTVLLFQAIDQESRGDVDIFRPTEKNLELAFVGVDSMEEGRAVHIANELVRKEILFKKPGKIETFATMRLNGDMAKIEQLKKSVADNVRTAELVENSGLIEEIKLSFTQSQKARFLLYPATADNFTSIINRITNEGDDFRIKTVICFARNENEQNKIYGLLKEAVNGIRYNKLVIIDASSNLINREIFNRWVENSANEKYWRGKDNPLADKMKNNAADCLRDWKNSFENGFFVCYAAVKDNSERKGISCQGLNRIKEELIDNVRRLFPYSVDDANITETLFQAGQWKKFPEAGIKQESVGNLLKTSDIKIILGDLWQMSGKYWQVYPDLNISRLKIELDTLIKNEIEKNSRISFDEIIDYVLERGFMPLNIYGFLIGFLLKEYSADPYRYSAGIDGNQGGAMNLQKLAECIGESLKKSVAPVRGYRPKYLEIMSQNQRQFMDFAAKVFGVSEDVSVEHSAQKLRNKITNLGYPLWCYIDAAEEKYRDFLNLLIEIANSKQSVGISSLAENAGQFLINNPSAVQYLKEFLNAEKGREIFVNFLKNFEGGIIFDLAKKIGMNRIVEECQTRIAFGDAIWLQDKETATEEIQKFIVDLKIVFESQKFGIVGNSLNSCVRKWKEFCRLNLKIPADVIGNYYRSVKEFFEVLKEIVIRDELPQNKREFFLCQLLKNSETINVVIFDPIKILREKFSYQVGSLNENEVNDVYAKLSFTSFTDPQGHFVKNLNSLIQKIKDGKLKNELLDLWYNFAGKKSPREWSNMYRTPILAMVPKSEQSDAKKVFDTIMNNSPEEKDIKFATDYLRNYKPYLTALTDRQKIEEAFQKMIVGEEYDILLDNNEEVRNELESKFRGDAYQWYPNVRVNEIVKKFAENKYYNGGAYEKLTERVMKMSDEDAKKLLIDLLDKNYEVGLKLLKES